LVQKIGRLSPDASQAPLKDLNSCLKGSQHICQTPASGDMEVGHMEIGIGDCIQDHGEVTVYLIGGSRAVMVSMLNIIGTDGEKTLGKLNRIL
jgi:hypothetical protein